MGIAKKGTGQIPQGTPLRMEHISPEGRTNLNAQMSELGMAQRDQGIRIKALRDTAADPAKTPKTKAAATRRITTYEAMEGAGVYKDRPITFSNATRSQTGLISAARGRASADVGMAAHDPGRVGEVERQTIQVPEYTTKAGKGNRKDKRVKTGETREMDIGPTKAGLGHMGADWYFEHHGKLADTADQTGHSHDQVIAASAVMSPQNNPDNEHAAVHALAHAHADPNARVTISKEAVAKSKDESLNDFVGRSVHPSKLAPSQLASIKEPGVRELVQTKGNVDLASMAKGGTSENVVKAIDVLRGTTKPQEAIDAHSSPKVWSYHEAIKDSVPGTAQHEEFLTRMDVSLRQQPGQQRMDLFGLKDSKEGILDPKHPIANDTWMQAAQSGQQHEVVDTGRSGKARMQSPAKFGVGEAGAASEKRLKTGGVIPGASPPMLRHAWGQESVERVGRAESRRSGETIPSVGAQAVPWTEIRRGAGGGKDITYERQAESYAATQRPTTEITHRETRWNPEAGKHEFTGGTSRMNIETHPTPGKGQGSMFTQDEHGAELVNQKAVVSQMQQKRLAKQATAKQKTEAKGDQGSLFG